MAGCEQLGSAPRAKSGVVGMSRAFGGGRQAGMAVDYALHGRHMFQLASKNAVSVWRHHAFAQGPGSVQKLCLKLTGGAIPSY